MRVRPALRLSPGNKDRPQCLAVCPLLKSRCDWKLQAGDDGRAYGSGAKHRGGTIGAALKQMNFNRLLVRVYDPVFANTMRPVILKLHASIIFFGCRGQHFADEIGSGIEEGFWVE